MMKKLIFGSTAVLCGYIVGNYSMFKTFTKKLEKNQNLPIIAGFKDKRNFIIYDKRIHMPILDSKILKGESKYEKYFNFINSISSKNKNNSNNTNNSNSSNDTNNLNIYKCDNWRNLENIIIKLKKDYDTVLYTTGPLFLAKIDRISGKHIVFYELIGEKKNIHLPTHFFVIVGCTKRDKDGKNVPYINTYIFPNGQFSDSIPFEKCKVELDIINQFTGLNFEKPKDEPKRIIELDIYLNNNFKSKDNPLIRNE
jgi:DNA/RNA endonuclease G (NUC1)